MNPPSDNKTQINSILDFLNEGEKLIEFDENIKNTVLVLGNTGAGKSTFTQYIAGDNNNLISQELSEGEFIITDTNNKISNNSTITSKTIYPELVFNNKTNTAFYDCPGFSDTRSAEYDIASTYFIKKVIDTIRNVKFVFIISYSSVKFGNDRLDFPLLVKHATKVIKNIDKFQNSIALVVTKVNNVYVRRGGQLNLVSDKNVIEGIVNFLKGVIDELKQKDEKSNENAIKFIEILLAQNGEKYTKIGIIRNIEEPGRFSEIKLLQNRKVSLEKLVYENIQCISHDKEDFGYTISSDSKIHVQSVITEITNRLTLKINNVGQEIQNYYYFKESQSSDIQKLYEIFKLGCDEFLETKLSEFVETVDFINEFIKKVNHLKIDIASKDLVSIINYDQYIQFLQTVSDQTSPTLFNRTNALSDMIDYLNNSKNWYDFLIKLHLRLSEYTIQNNTNKYDVTQLKRSQTINKIELKHFLDQITMTQEMAILFHYLKNVIVNNLKFNTLKNLLDLTLNYQVNKKCLPNNKLLVSGQYIRLSDINMTSCPAPIKFIEIFALNKIFIDKNFNENLQLSIISPTWEIVGKAVITLDGKPGLAHIDSKAEDGKSSRIDGKDGKPGLPGGSAGNFFGIGKIFINGENLKISANGGKGGPGQHGGNGLNGTNGKTPPDPRPTRRPGYNVFSTMDADMDFDTRYRSWSYTLLNSNINIDYDHKQYKVHGTNCSNSGDGGNGGASGNGGNAGYIVLIEMNEESKILRESKTGESSTGGKGGIAGSAKNGNDLIVNDTYNRDKRRPDSIPTLESTNYGEMFSGTDGINGFNIKEIEIPKQVIFPNPPLIINTYKIYLRENLSDRINESVLMKFLNELEDNQMITAYYDTLGLVNELHGLENQYQNLHRKLPFQLFYKSLLNRIRKYAEKPKEHEKSIEYKKVLSYLYTATLSKICSIDINTENNLVIDINNYLNEVVKNINKLKESTNVVSINNYQDNFQKSINDKIENAKNFIDTEITTEINIIIGQLDNQIELLFNETVALKTNIDEEKKN